MFEHEMYGGLLRIGYTIVAALAGAVTALSLLSWQEMSLSERFFTVFVGFSFAVFVTPWVATLVFGNDASPQMQAGLTYVMGCGVNSILPPLIRKIRRLIGTDEESER